MATCEKALDILDAIGENIGSLRELIYEEKEEKKPKSIREKAEKVARLTWKTGAEEQIDLIESLVREELGACVKLFEDCGYPASAEKVREHILIR